MRLFAKIRDPELLRKVMHEAGTAFYHFCGDGLVEVVYFSSNRHAYFKGKLNQQDLQSVKAFAFEVERINIDEFSGLIVVNQFKEG